MLVGEEVGRMGGVVEVRALGAEDWQVTKRLRLAALRDAPDAFGGTYEPSAQRTEAQWREWPASGQTFAAYVDGEPVGMVCGVPADDPGKTHLISMWVSPNARGKGIGKHLIDAVAGWAWARGSKAVELNVYEGNEVAYRAYLQAGFTPVGPSPDHPGAIVMTLSISATA